MTATRDGVGIESWLQPWAMMKSNVYKTKKYFIRWTKQFQPYYMRYLKQMILLEYLTVSSI